jgi:hypothetical protein
VREDGSGISETIRPHFCTPPAYLAATAAISSSRKSSESGIDIA